MILRELKYPLSNYLIYFVINLFNRNFTTMVFPAGIAFWLEFYVVARHFPRARHRLSGVLPDFLIRSFSRTAAYESLR